VCVSAAQYSASAAETSNSAGDVIFCYESTPRREGMARVLGNALKLEPTAHLVEGKGNADAWGSQNF